MATGTQATTARRFHTQQTHYLRKRIAWNDAGLTGIVGVLPEGAIIVRGSVYVFTAFNTGTLNVGKQGGDADEYASALALTKAIVAFDDLVIDNARMTADTVVTYARSTAQSAGEAEILVEFIVDNDR